MEPYGTDSKSAVRYGVDDVYGRTVVVVAQERVDAFGFDVLRGQLVDPGEVPAIHQVVLMRQRCVGEAVLTQYLGGDALAQSVGMLWVEEQSAIGMGVGIDESWRNGQAGRVDNPVCAGLCVGEVPDGYYVLAVYSDVGGAAGCPGAIYHGTP
jgi:hypothetical protein